MYVVCSTLSQIALKSKTKNSLFSLSTTQNIFTPIPECRQEKVRRHNIITSVFFTLPRFFLTRNYCFIIDLSYVRVPSKFSCFLMKMLAEFSASVFKTPHHYLWFIDTKSQHYLSNTYSSVSHLVSVFAIPQLLKSSFVNAKAVTY